MITFLLTIFLIPALGGAEDEARTGRAALRRAVDALGGTARLGAHLDWVAEGKGRENLSAEMQGLAADEPTWRPHEESVAADLRTLAVAWDRRTPRNDGSVRWRRMVFTADTFGFVDWAADAGARRPRATPEAYRRALARRIPHVLLHEAATRATHVAVVEGAANGRHDVISVELPEARPLTLHLARDPALLSRVEFPAYLPGKGDVTVSWTFLDWRKDDALGHVPGGHRVAIGDVPFQEVTYARYGVEPARARELLEVPERYLVPRPAAPPPAAPPAESLPAEGLVQPGVLVTRVGGFVVMAVEFRDFVAVFDAPEAHPGFEGVAGPVTPTRLTEEHLEKVRAAIPGKPVRYAVISHHHGDHMGGLRSLAAAGAIVLVPEPDEAAARRLLGPAATVEAVRAGERRVITDGERTLEAWNVGRNPHTEGNLMAWLPAERIAMQGDLFYYDGGGRFPPPGRETMNRFFAEWLAARGMEPRAVYGVHNQGAAGPQWLDAARRPAR